MNEVFFLTLLCGGMSELIAQNGGIEWIIQKLGKVMKGNKSAQVGIAALVSLWRTAPPPTTPWLSSSAGDMAREVMLTSHKVDPRRTASLLDMFSCVFQGIIPYGAQLLVASSLCNATVTNGTTISAARHPWLSVVLLVPGCFRHPVHLHPLRRWCLPQGSLELGV